MDGWFYERLMGVVKTGFARFCLKEMFPKGASSTRVHLIQGDLRYAGFS